MDVCRSASVDRRDMRRWRKDQIKDDGVQAKRIEQVLSGTTYLQRPNHSAWLRTPVRSPGKMHGNVQPYVERPR
jgi:hypothetical protein